jgi:hypothetical protein
MGFPGMEKVKERWQNLVIMAETPSPIASPGQAENRRLTGKMPNRQKARTGGVITVLDLEWAEEVTRPREESE